VTPVDPASEAQSIHRPAHFHIAHDNINRLARGKHRDGLRDIGGFDHHVARDSQVFCDGGADQILILNN